MHNIDIYIPPKAFRYLMSNIESRSNYTKNNPLYVVYYRHRDGALGSAVLNIPNLTTFVGQCVFKTRKQKEEFVNYFIPSLRSQISESDKTNYRWRTYDLTEYSWKLQ